MLKGRGGLGGYSIGRIEAEGKAVGAASLQVFKLLQTTSSDLRPTLVLTR